MRREQTLEEISDGKLYDSNDMVKADCHDCEGCCDCCQGMGDSVILDPYDVHRGSQRTRRPRWRACRQDLRPSCGSGCRPRRRPHTPCSTPTRPTSDR